MSLPSARDRETNAAVWSALIYPGGGYFRAGHPLLGLAVGLLECSLIVLFLVSLSETTNGLVEAVPFLFASGILLAVQKAISVDQAERLAAPSVANPDVRVGTLRLQLWAGVVAISLLVVLGAFISLQSADDHLIEAVRVRDVEGARRALEAGANADATDEDGITALLLAARNGDSPTLTLLLAAGADLNKADRQGLTPLVAAALRGHHQVFRTLAGAGADIEVKGDDGVTFLMEAASAGRTDIVSSLLALGAELEARDVDGWTPLMWAAVAGHGAVVEALLDAGANPALRNNQSRTALDVAERAGQIEVVGILENAIAETRDQ